MPLLPTSNLLLMNFRIPRDLKLQFQSACRTRDTFMTAELLRFIRAYLLDASRRPSSQTTTTTMPPRTQPRSFVDPHTGFVISAPIR